MYLSPSLSTDFDRTLANSVINWRLGVSFAGEVYHCRCDRECAIRIPAGTVRYGSSRISLGRDAAISAGVAYSLQCDTATGYKRETPCIQLRYDDRAIGNPVRGLDACANRVSLVRRCSGDFVPHSSLIDRLNRDPVEYFVRSIDQNAGKKITVNSVGFFKILFLY